MEAVRRRVFRRPAPSPLGRPEERAGPAGREGAARWGPGGARWGAALAAGALLCVLLCALPARLPAPLPEDAPPEQFSAARAGRPLAALTALGPRVAGSPAAAAAASLLERALLALPGGAHHRVQVERYEGHGAFPLRFLDGLSNVYRGAPSVVARVGRRREREGTAADLLLNCHYDTVPDSPGASDDAAGCAVVLEVARALAAGPALRRGLVLLLNGAEENLLQAAHAWAGGHRWARGVAAFVNVEACGAGGREVLFQAGPRRAAALLRAYSRAPRPRASSLAQELFRSGLLPAETDFRVLRDRGGLAGLDLAWSDNGYVYHTALDRDVPLAALQHTGDNVLALVRELLRSAELEGEVGDAGDEDVAFFDVLGLGVLVVGRAGAAAALLGGLALLGRGARARGWRRSAAAGAVWAGAAAAGAGGAAALGGAARAAGGAMCWYSRPALLAPAYGLPALGAAGLLAGGRRGLAEGQLLCWAGLALGCWAAGLRSGLLASAWLLLGAGGLAAGGRAGWAAGCVLPALVTGDLALASLRLLVPLSGRAGASLPVEELVAALTGALALGSLGWAVAAAGGGRRARLLYWGCVSLGAAALVAAASGCRPYSPERPQRLMLFRTRRTLHWAGSPPQTRVWVPELDAHTARTLSSVLPPGAPQEPECAPLLYCGAPYYLPVSSFISRGRWVPAAVPEPPHMEVTATVRERAGGAELTIAVAAPPHLVVIISPAAGVRLEGVTAECDNVTSAVPLVAGPSWGGRDTYFLLLTAGSGRWGLRARLGGAGGGGRWADLSVGGHWLGGGAGLGGLPDWTTVTGWPVDLHLYRL